MNACFLGFLSLIFEVLLFKVDVIRMQPPPNTPSWRPAVVEEQNLKAEGNLTNELAKLDLVTLIKFTWCLWIEMLNYEKEKAQCHEDGGMDQFLFLSLHLFRLCELQLQTWFQLRNTSDLLICLFQNRRNRNVRNFISKSSKQTYYEPRKRGYMLWVAKHAKKTTMVCCVRWSGDMSWRIWLMDFGWGPIKSLSVCFALWKHWFL